MNKILLVDDDRDLRKALTQTLGLAGFKVEDFSNARDALSKLDSDWSGAVISDLKMPGMDGLSLLKNISALDMDIPVVLITGHGDVSVAVKAIQYGAYDFIEKPFRKATLIEVLNRAIEKRKLVLENRNLRNKLAKLDSQVLVGESASMINLRKQIKSIAEADVDVLINGETGTGKELVANELYRQSSRHNGPLVAVNCAAIADALVESELFGHEAGSFTGALKQRIGKFEYANTGIIFLDEIESIPLSLAAKILRVLQERKLERVGSNSEVELDIRVLAATKVDLKEQCQQGKFREDLYYRLNVVELIVPPLRERKEDIALLFDYFVNLASEKFNRERTQINAQLIRELSQYDWPGNVRELKNVADRFVLSDQLPDLSFPIQLSDTGSSDSCSSLHDRVQAYEKSVMIEELERQHGDVRQSSEALKIPRKTFYDKMKKYSIDRHSFTVLKDSSTN